MKTAPFLTASALFPILVAAADAPSFTYSGKFDAVGGGSTTVTLEEVSRTATSFVVRVSGRAPVSGLHNRFLVLAMCSLAKSKAESYFQVKVIDEGLQTFEVSFPNIGPAVAAPGSFPANATAPNTFPVSACP
jgi:hypothetical protein